MRSPLASLTAAALMANDQPRLRALLKIAEIAAGMVCPFCQGKELQDNGATRQGDLEILCETCGEVSNPYEQAERALEELEEAAR